jgi:hypothetical protein
LFAQHPRHVEPQRSKQQQRDNDDRSQSQLLDKRQHHPSTRSAINVAPLAYRTTPVATSNNDLQLTLVSDKHPVPAAIGNDRNRDGGDLDQTNSMMLLVSS